jgi:hypothetical protein
MVPKPFLSVQIYSNRCEYDILKVLLRNNDQNSPVRCVKHKNGYFWWEKLLGFSGFWVVCYVKSLDIVHLGTINQSYYANLIKWSIQIIFLLPEPIHAHYLLFYDLAALTFTVVFLHFRVKVTLACSTLAITFIISCVFYINW